MSKSFCDCLVSHQYHGLWLAESDLASISRPIRSKRSVSTVVKRKPKTGLFTQVFPRLARHQLLAFSSSSDWFVLLFQRIVIGPKSLNMNNLQENHKKTFPTSKLTGSEDGVVRKRILIYSNPSESLLLLMPTSTLFSVWNSLPSTAVMAPSLKPNPIYHHLLPS